MQIQQLLCLQKSTLNVFFIFSAFMGGQKGPVFYIYYERITGHRSKLKIFAEGGFILPLYFSVYMRAYEGYACKSLLPTNGEGGKSLEEENIWSETGINGPVFSPFIMKGYAGHVCKPYPIPERKIDDEAF